MKQKKSISAPKKGMNRDAHSSQLDNVSYNLAVNVNTTNEQGDILNVQLETSNYYGVLFPTNYKVIGFETDLLKERTYYLLTNITTDQNDTEYKRSSIGYVNNSQVEDIDYNNIPTTDLNDECDGCGNNAFNTLPTPLEDIVQTPSLIYVELLHDKCIPLIDLEELGLNFNINFPAKKIEINQEKLGTTLYWNDFRNPPRYLNVTDVEEKGALSYVFEVFEPCDDSTYQNCLNVDRLRIFPKHNKIQLEPTEEQIGGNLKKGTYEYWAAYCDLMGNEMTEYCTPTNPVSIFDRENNILGQTETDEFTNFVIKLKVKGLDSKNFKYYKVAVVERNNVNNTQSVFLVGIYPTSDDTILHTHSGSNNDDLYIARGNVSIQKRMDFNTLLAVKPNWEKAKGTMVSGDILFHHGLIQKEEINLQPVFNIFGSLLHWQTSIATEELYKNSIATSKYKGYRRDEVQPFSVRAFFKDGGYSPSFPLIARPPRLNDLSFSETSLVHLNDSDKNYKSVTEKVNCQSTDRNQKWQVYNTATVFSGDCLPDGFELYVEILSEELEKTCRIEDVHIIPTDEITISLDEDFYDLESYLEDNPPTFLTIPKPTPTSSFPPTTHVFQAGLHYLIYQITPDNFSSVGYTTEGQSFLCTTTTSITWSNGSEVYLLKAEIKDLQEKLLQKYSLENCSPPFDEDFCSVPVLTNEQNVVSSIIGETKTFVEKLESEYTKVLSITNNSCNIYERDGNGYLRDSDYENTYMSIIRTSGNIVSGYNCERMTINVRTISSNQSCDLAEDIINITNPNEFNGSSIVINYGASFNLNDLKNNSYNSQTTLLNPSPVPFNQVPVLFHIPNLIGVTNINTSTGFFSDKLHKNALFYKVVKNNRNKIVFEIGKRSGFTSSDSTHWSDWVRFTIYNNCNGTIMYKSGLVDVTQGYLEIIDTTFYPNTFYIAIDSPIIEGTRYLQCDPSIPSTQQVFYITPPKACFSIYTRDIEYSEVKVGWEEIKLDKVQTYVSNCTYRIPRADGCNPIPFRKGEFAFWQSIEEYDNNKELWDSSNIKIKPDDIVNLNDKDKESFLDYYVRGGFISPETDIDGYYILEQRNTNNELESLDFRCKKIRHPKFPDNTITPFITDTTSFKKNADSIIYPLGVEIDSNVFQTAINVAYNNGLITKKELENITGFEILRGDNSISKSVISNGIAFDMYNYTKKNNKIHFANFPFNDLGDNKYLLQERGGNLVTHPENGNSNYLYSFLSPDIFLTKPSIPTEVSLQGYLVGASRQEFVATDKHSEWTILGEKARRMALTLATAEAILETVLGITDMQKEASAGWTWNIGNIIAASLRAVAYGVSAYMRVGKYRYDWLKIFRDLGKTHNFASMQVGVGHYNRFIASPTENNNDYLRRLRIRKYLREGKYTFVDESNGEEIKVNNWLRESSAFLSVGKEYDFTYLDDYKSIDNNKLDNKSSNFLCSEVGNVENQEFIRDIASPYFTLKNYIPNQWGTIDNVKWLTTNHMIHLGEDSECKTIFGGTVCISRFSWRRKIPIFSKNAIFHADKQAFMYSRYDNIAYPRFWANYEIDDDDALYTGGIGVFPDINSKYNFDGETGRRGMYVKPPSKLYTSIHGIVDFLVESEINCNFRHARKENKDWFYPQHTDLPRWLQESTLSLSEPNTFFYNNSYTFPVSNTPYKFLDKTYSKEVWKKRVNQINAVSWSQKEVNENDLTNPWLVYKPLDWYEFKTNNGELIDLHNIESNQFLARFENKLMLHNAIDNIAERITPQNRELGIAGVFLQRPMEHKATDLGFAGTQNTDIVSTPYGHFWCDALRGKVFKVDQNGQGLEIISEVVGGQPSNMKQWFREHLPFKILKYFPGIDINNKFKGLGINMWWDDRESRVFITKRDYIPKNKTGYEVIKGVLYQDGEEVFFDNGEFIDVSWTISLKPMEGTWNSYFSFYPDYSPFHNNFFQVGYNWGQHKETLWNHLMNNSSFCVFQGVKHTPILEFPITNENVNKLLNSISLNIEGKHYQNDWDFAIDKDKSFKNLFIFNPTNNTGMLELFPQKGLKDVRKYPITEGNIQKILYTSNEDKQNINYFFNRIVNQNNNIPMFNTDKNNIFKTINDNAVKFTGKRVLERLKGEYFTVHLEGIQDTRFNLILKNIINNETIY